MLTFRNTNIVLILLLLLTIVLNTVFNIPVFVYVLLLLAYSIILFYGCSHINAGFFVKAICSGDTTKKEIAISFDDGPAINFTPQILQVLKENNVEAAFFCIGNRIAGNEKIFKQLNDEGHIIGNHSYSHHFWFDMFSSKKMLQDLKRMDQHMKDVTGFQPKLFRPPYGVTNPNLKKAINEGNYITIGWNVRSMDTVIKNDAQLLEKINSSIKPGAIFLFHDTSKTTLSVLSAFIKQAKQSGYEIVRLDKMLNLKAYA